jgi:shikimate 5-dehydrogenase
VLQVLNSPTGARFFAAVLGSPVRHSWTPTHQQRYFSEKGAPVFAIDVQPEEWSEAIRFLQELGLRWAAVTAPLKECAAQWLHKETPINTLCYTTEGWKGVNTDDHGLQQALQGIECKNVAVWGGGGTLNSIRQVCPQALFYSSRSGQPRDSDQAFSPTTLIWAVGASPFRERGVFPPSDWPLQRVIDLNYNSDSPGIECAWKFGCQYLSGAVMFAAQAEKQQEFWNECRVE